jgi:molybdopterin-guanine dinucleotide biosynthesis protein
MVTPMNTSQLPTLRLIIELLRRGNRLHAIKSGERFRFDLAKEIAPSWRHQVRGALIVRRADDGRWVLEPDSIEF